MFRIFTSRETVESIISPGTDSYTTNGNDVSLEMFPQEWFWTTFC